MDKDECLYKHEESSNKETDTSEMIFCKKGMKCPRTECTISNSGHKNIRDVPCKYQQKCKKDYCPFKHLDKKSDFPMHIRKHLKT